MGQGLTRLGVPDIKKWCQLVTPNQSTADENCVVQAASVCWKYTKTTEQKSLFALSCDSTKREDFPGLALLLEGRAYEKDPGCRTNPLQIKEASLIA